jgi:hypothetical protein
MDRHPSSTRLGTCSHIAPAHERAGMLEPVTSRDRCVRGRSLGRTESSLTFGRHRPPRENHSAGMGYGSRWCRQPESLRGSIAARTNENARLRQQLEAAATVVATLHHRRENIGRNGRSRGDARSAGRSLGAHRRQSSDDHRPPPSGEAASALRTLSGYLPRPASRTA